MPGPAHTRRSKRDLLPYQLDQTAARQRKVRQNEGGMKDENMDDTEGCNGQGHITMEILQQDDIEGDCCGYLTQTHTSRSLIRRERERDGWKSEGDRNKGEGERVMDGKRDRFGLCYGSNE